MVNGLAEIGGQLLLDLPSGDPAATTTWLPVSAMVGVTGTFGTTPAGYTTSYTANTVRLTKN